MRRWPAALVLLAVLAARPAPADDSVAHVVFEPGRFASVTPPRTLVYRFETRGRGIEAPLVSPGRLEVRDVTPEGVKQVWLELFEGEARRVVGPMSAREQNPILLAFLQMDVAEMGRLTTGSAMYFQQQIRKQFNSRVPTEPVEVELDGKALPATRITIKPFATDPRIDQFPAFRDKTYEFTVSDQVPGGLWSIVTRTPDPETGELVLEKSMTFVAGAG
ncbi:MAG TPA: hypothetical protein PKA13_14900 [Geminicoccaceae bacterium]|nr:hypothetical protein [Geminicoccus sp.]HMU51061.1 hypothetical protein [Geminicoccaceae bacterium]